jgi:hypothetical protein
MSEHKLPGFLSDEAPLHPPVVFKPEHTRRGEWVAWMIALALALAMALQTVLSGSVDAIVRVLFIIVLIAACLITYANWMERNTLVCVSPAGVEYRSPLRKVELRYSQIQEIWLAPSRSAWRISVLGETGHFNFQTLVTLESIAGSAIMGIAGGKQLAAHLIRASGMLNPDNQDGIWIWKRQPG